MGSGRLISAQAASKLWGKVCRDGAAAFCDAPTGRTLQKPKWREAFRELGIEVRPSGEGRWVINRDDFLHVMRDTFSAAVKRIEEEMDGDG